MPLPAVPPTAVELTALDSEDGSEASSMKSSLRNALLIGRKRRDTMKDEMMSKKLRWAEK